MKKVIRASLFLSFFAFCIIGGLVFLFHTAIKVAGVPPITMQQTNIFYGDDGSIIAQDYIDENRYWVPLNKINIQFQHATIAIEDQHFYDHHGFDFTRIFGAIVADIKAMKLVQGASTITQQLARNTYLNHEKTWSRKIKEAIYTIRLEENESKKTILESYLNTIYYGNQAYGIEAASQLYFGKNASDLTLAESAVLAGIPKNPSYYSPFAHPTHALERQQFILKQMYNQKRISLTQYKEAKAAKITFQLKQKKATQNLAPYFIDAVIQQVKDKVTDDQFQEGGLHIYTTLNPTIQSLVDNAVKQEIPTSSTIQTAVVVEDPLTGDVKALVGGRNYQASPFNRATQAVRQPGSTIKPLLYYTALENGFTPSTSFVSEKTNLITDDNGDIYAPNNATHTYANRKITMLEALALSDNIYAMKTLQEIGESTFTHDAKQFQIHTPLEQVPSLALGTSPVKPIELMNAYGMIANGGQQITPTFITKITDANGKVLYEGKRQKVQLLKQDSTYILADLMKGIFEKNLSSYMTVTGFDLADQITHDYSGKSGSTKTDSWMIGFTPQLLAGVWVGYDDNTHLKSVTQYRYAKHIWLDIMEEALSHTQDKASPKPDDVIGVIIDPHTGKLASTACSVTRTVYYKKGTEPTELCDESPSSQPVSPPTDMPTKKSWIGGFF